MTKNLKKSHHNDFIDEYDLEKIVNKEFEIGRIIGWLERLVELDEAIDRKAIAVAIEHLTYKKDILHQKAEAAREDLIEEAGLIASLYEVDDE